MSQNWSKINQQSILAYQKKLAEDLNLSPATVKRRLSSIRKFCEWAQKEGYLQENPFKPQEELPERITYTPNKLKSSLSKAYKTYHSIPATKYFHWAILIIFCAALGYGAYDQFFKKVPSPFAFPTSLTRPNRFLSFQGRLTDSSNNPIGTATNITFKLWNIGVGGTEGTCTSQVGESCLWTSQACSVDPDEDGIFSVILGTTTGDGYTCSSAIEIPATVFSENQNIYLGVKVASDAEMTPRIQVATVGYALNAETLQGYPPGTGANSIPYINNAGDIIIAAASPMIQSTSGTFSIEGQTGVTIQAGTGVGGSITISPKGDTGVVNITSEVTTGDLLNNQSGANFGTVGGKEANNLYYGYAGTNSTNLNLLKLESGAIPLAKFTVDASGNASAAGILKALTTGSYFTGDVTVSGGDITGSNGVVLDIGEADANYITSSVGLAVGGGNTYYINSSGTGNLNALTLAGDLTVDTNDFFVDVSENKIGIGTTALTERLTLSGNATISGTLSLGPQVQAYAGECNTSSAGKMYYDGNSHKYYFCNGSDWTEMGAGAASYWALNGNNLYPNSTAYNLGIGLTNPGSKLSVAGGVAIGATYAPLSAPANGLIVQGNVGIGTTNPTSAFNVGASNQLGIDSSGNLSTSGTLTAATTNTLNGLNINTGTITAGTWNGNKIAVQYGGTGQDWSAVLQGALPIFSGTGIMTTLGTSTAGYVLQTNGVGSNPSWADLSSTAGPWTLTGSNLYPDSTTYNVGIGLTNPTNKLSVAGAAAIGATYATITAPANGLIVQGNTGIGTTNPTSVFNVGASNQLAIDSSGNLSTSGTLTAATTNTINSLSINAGTITAGTWAGNKIAVQYGGTGQDWSAILQGNIPYFSGTGIMTTLAPSTAGFVLQTNGTSANPTWVDLSSSATAGPWTLTGTNLYPDSTTYNVGIGLTNPGSKLSVAGGESIGATYAPLSAPANGLIVQGNVGIGTTNPSSTLDVVGTVFLRGASGQTGLAVNSSGNVGIGTTGSSTYALYVVGNSAFNSGTIYTDSNNYFYVNRLVDTSGTNYYLDPGSSSYAGLFNGSVGIGTTAPATALEVVGEIRGTKFTFQDSTNTYLDTLATDKLSLFTNNVGRLTIDSSGNVGIGTTNPSTGGKLSVAGNMILGSTYVGNGATAPTNGLLVQGNVGVGTTSPSALFSVGSTSQFQVDTSGNLNTSGTLTAATSNTLNGLSINSGTITAGTWNGNNIAVQYGGTGQNWSGVLQGNIPYFSGTGIMTTLAPSTAGFVLQTNGVGANPSWIDISSTGGPWTLTGTNLYPDSTTYNVGIGLTNPGSKLSVAGGVVIGATYAPLVAPTNGLAVQGNVGIGTTNPATALEVLGEIRSTRFAFQDSTNTYFDTLTTDKLSLFTNNVGRLTIDSSGNVGIGTTNPSTGGKLSLAGNMILGSTYVGNGATAPTNGLLVEGNVGIGTTSLGAYTLYVVGNTALNSGNVYTDNNNYFYAARFIDTANTNYFLDPAAAGSSAILNGNVGIGTTAPANKLSLSGSGSIGATYATITAPTNGLIVQGNTGIGTTNPTSAFNVGATNQLAIDSSGNLSTSGTLTAATTNTLNGLNINTGTITAGTWNGNKIAVQYGGTGQDWSSVLQGSIPYFSGAGVMTTLGTGTAGYVLQTNGPSQNPSWVAQTGGTNFWSLTGNNLYPTSTIYNVGIGLTNPANKLSVAGAVSIGSTYAGLTAPANSLIVQGSIGIGTTNPTTALQVVGATILGNGLTGSEDALLVNTGAAFSGNLLKLSVNSTQKFAINASGDVTTASGLFTSGVADGGSAIGFKLITPSYTTTGAKLFSVWNNTSEKFSLDKDGVGTFYGTGGSLIDNTSGDITIDAASNNISLAMDNLINVGKIGIGRTTPSSQLDVAGDATFSGTISLAPQVQAYAGNCDTTRAGKMYYNAAQNKYYYCNSTTWTEIGSGSGTSYWALSGGNLYPISLSYNVGIGTSTPANKLSVVGNANISSNLGIGTTNPLAPLSVGSSSQFQVDTSGNLNTSGTLTAATSNTINGISINSGTITGGSWNGANIAVQYGGTGQNWSGVAQGNLPYFSGSGTMTTLAPSTAGYVLQTGGTGANPSWVDISASGGPWTLAGNNLYPDSTNYNVAIGSNEAGTADLYVNGSLGIGTTNPLAALSVGSSSQFQVNSSGVIAAATGITSSGNITLSSLNAGGIVKAAGGTGLLSIATGGAGGDYEYPLTFSSGLTRLLNVVSLGGTLSQTTTITQGNNPFTINNNGTSNTIINLSSTGDLDIQANGISALFVNDSGNVGIGTSTPTNKLSVAGRASIGSGYTTVTAPTNGLIVQGNVGIGTTAPATALEVVGEIRGTKFTFQDSTNTYLDTLTTDKLSLFTNNASRLTIDSSGNVGIGTTSPINKLSLSGAMSIGSTYAGLTAPANSLIVQSSIGIGTTNPTTALQVVGATILGNGLTGSENALLVNVGAGFSGNLLKLDVNSTQKLAIDSTGMLTTASGVFKSSVADGGSAVAFTFDTLISYTAPGAKLLSIKNAGSEKMSLDKDGVLALYNSESMIYNSSGDITIDAASNNVSLATNNLINVNNLTLGGIASMSGTPNLTLIPTSNLAKIYLLNGGDLGFYTSVGGDTGVSQKLKISNSGEATISGTLSLAPQVEAFAGTCNTSIAGKMYYNASQNAYYFCNGSVWTSIGTGYWALSGSNLYSSLTSYNVSIGTTNPSSYKLYVAGNVAFNSGNIYSDSNNYLSAARFVDTANSNYFVDPAAAGFSAILNGSVGIGTTSPTSKLDVSGDINFTGKLLEDGVEVLGGVVAMWSGSVASIPAGWYLCDGTNGTPDLRGRFVVGAGGSYGVGATGGEETHTLTTAEMPAHTHSISTYGGYQVWWNNSYFVEIGVMHSPTAGSTGSTGGGGAHENRPPYYALAYIMKKYGADLAEWIPATGPAPPGTIMSIDPEKRENVKASNEPYDSKVAGIITTSPDTVMGRNAPGNVQMALSGRVPTKVSLINGEIKSGDPITSSSINGVGMKATQNGPIVGKAMETLTPQNANEECFTNAGEKRKCGTILVFVNVSWFNPGTNENNNLPTSDPNYQFLRFKEDVSEGDLVDLEYQQIEDGIKIASYLSKAVSQPQNTSKTIAGVISKTIGGKGELLKREFNGNQITAETRLVSTGNAEVKISPSSEAIQPGDSLVFSDNPGMATKTTKVGPTFGKALENWTSGSGKETIYVLMASGWYDPDIYLTSTGELNVNNENQTVDGYQLKDKNGNLIKRIGAFAEIVVAKIKAGLIKTQELIAEKKISAPQIETQRINLAEISSSTESGNIIINLQTSPEASESAFGQLIVKGKEGQTVASIDAEGNATFAGSLTSNNASIAGTLYADEIMTKYGKFGDLLASLQNQSTASSAAESTESALIAESEIASSSATASPSATMSEEEINQLINEILASVPEATSQAILAESLTLPSATNYNPSFNQEGNLTVLGNTSLANTTIAGSLNIDGTLTLADNSLNTLTGPLYLQNLGLGGLDILAGKITIDEHGNAVFGENVTIKGDLAVNTIKPLPEKDLVIDLAQIPISSGFDTFLDNPATESAFGNLLVKGFDGQVVASIDASGSAHFASIGVDADYNATQSGTIIAAYDNWQQTGQYSPALNTNATAGVGVLPNYEKEVMIYNSKITDQSLIYITPITDTSNKVIYAKAKQAEVVCLPEDNACQPKKGWFKVAIDSPINKEIKFNWWIVN